LARRRRRIGFITVSGVGFSGVCYVVEEPLTSPEVLGQRSAGARDYRPGSRCSLAAVLGRGSRADE
jgi:hypothetical protein